MNIKEAKQQITNAIKAYFTKDEFGRNIIPIERQRPIFLMGAPGIGKTAIMEQISKELGVGLVSYSMTHHTRQSALGLPYIETKSYGGQEYRVSEYTMSEIIASVYDMMEKTGVKEGILFLDEINCVSETLAPAMLQFLQYKTFGRHSVPEGWIVVTAGNPPEYNNSVREFDIVTWDRLKRVDVEPKLDVWKEYAYKKGVHPSIITYLDIKKDDFYKIESTVDGKTFVTARGWSDLSDMIKLYELHGIEVTEELVKQYIQNPRIAKSYAIYYDLFNKYRSDYQVDKILEGKASVGIVSRAKEAKFDERLSLLGLIIDAITDQMKNTVNMELSLREILTALKTTRVELSKPNSNVVLILEKQISEINKRIVQGKKASTMSEDSEYACRRAERILSDIRIGVEKAAPKTSNEAFMFVKQEFDKLTREMSKNASAVGKKLSSVFKFCEEAFSPNGQEMLILVTELTINYYGAHFISRYGCKEYFAHNKELLFYERQLEIIKDIEKLSLED